MSKPRAVKRLEAIRRLEARPADFSTYHEIELGPHGSYPVKRRVTSEAERALVATRRLAEAARLRKQFGLEGK